MEKPFVPQRIFLSYGHDSNEELVRRIKTDLEKRGHDVWFDKSEIKQLGTQMATTTSPPNSSASSKHMKRTNSYAKKRLRLGVPL